MKNVIKYTKLKTSREFLEIVKHVWIILGMEWMAWIIAWLGSYFAERWQIDSMTTGNLQEL